MCHSNECWYKEVCESVREDCYKTCPKYIEMKYLMDNSGIPKSKQRPLKLTPYECDLEAFRRLAEIKDNIVDFVEDGRNLYICSEAVGTGKTTWSLKLLMRYFEEVWEGNGLEIRGVIVHVPTFLLKCKDFKTVDEDFEQLKRTLLDVDLVVWDDIGGVTVSGYDYAQLLMYLDARDFSDLANIYTSNLTTRESFTDALGAKITSRVWNSKTEVIQFFGEERR